MSALDIGSFAAPTFITARAIQVIELAFDVVVGRPFAVEKMTTHKRSLIMLTDAEAFPYDHALGEAAFRLGVDVTPVANVIPLSARVVEHVHRLRHVAAYPHLRQYFEAGIWDISQAKGFREHDIDAHLVAEVAR